MACDDAVGRDLDLFHAEIVATVLDEHVQLAEGARVEKQVEPLAGGQFAALLLLFDGFGAAHLPGFLLFIQEFLDRVPGCLHLNIPLSKCLITGK